MKDNKKTPGKNRGPMGGGPIGVVEKPKNFKQTLKNILKYLRPYKTQFIIIVTFAIFSTCLMISGPKILGRATNVIAEGFIEQTIYDKVIESLPEGVSLPKGTTGEQILKMMPEEKIEQLSESQINVIKNMTFDERPGIDLDSLKVIALILLIVYIAQSLFNYIQSYILTGVSQQMTFKMREEVSKKINKLPLKYYDKKTHGDILSIVTNDVDTVGSNLSQNMSQMITTITAIIGILIMMLTISPVMTLIAIVILPVAALLLGSIIKFSQEYFKEQQTGLAKINGHIEEMYGGHTIIKAFNQEENSLEKFNEINEGLYDSAWKSQFFSTLMFPIMSFVGNMGYVAVCISGGYLVVKGKISIGDIQSFIQYVRNFTQQTSQGTQIISGFQTTIAAAERVLEFLAEEEEIVEQNKETLTTVKGQVTFDHVKFGYNESQTIINDFSIDVKPGQKVAIVGPTGAGKTTLVKLLMRFYDVNEGTIKIDGIDITEIKRSNLRTNIGMVLQDTWLFNGSIKENIRYGSKKATEDEILKAAEAAHINHFINTLPGGYDMEINEEANNISQGQKQLLTIARAILTDPKILILDEATSSVDTRTEILINKAMRNLMKNRTSFIIAHRLSTIKNADLILAINNGDIVEQGNHEELLKKNGFYATLYNSQFENAEEN